MSNKNKGPSAAEVQAQAERDRALRQSEAQYQQSQQMLASAESYTTIVAQELSEFDVAVGRAAGTSALALARSGSLAQAPRDRLRTDPTFAGALQQIDLIEQNKEAIAQQTADLNDTSSDATNPTAIRRNELASELAELQEELDSYPRTYTNSDGETVTEQAPRSLKRSFNEKQNELNEQQKRIDDMVSDLQETEERVDAFAERVNQLSDPDTIVSEAEDSALMFARGSVFRMVEQGISETLYNRDKFFQESVSNKIGMINNAMAVRRGAFNMQEEADAYSRVGDAIRREQDAADRSQRIGNILTGLGLVAGIATFGIAGGAIGLGSAVSAGATAGSFLGNVFGGR